MENKWFGLNTPNFRFVDLGRPAMFLLPMQKLSPDIENELHRFLAEQFGGFTFLPFSSFGVWIDGQKKIVYDECRLYEVSFVGKERIPVLGDKLAQICQKMGEECLYFKAGQYAALLEPRNSTP